MGHGGNPDKRAVFKISAQCTETAGRASCVCIYIMVATEEKELHGYETVYHQNDLTFNLKETLK